MVDKTSFTQEWIRMQQTFWDRYDNQQENNEISLNQWLKDVEWHWQKQATDVPTSVSTLYERLLFTSHVFVNFAEPFIDVNDESKDSGTVLVEYLEVFLEALEQEDGLDYDVKGFWKLPFELWQQQIDSLGGFPDSFLELVKHSIKDESFNEEFTQAGQNYLEALKRYQSDFVSMAIEAATALTKELQNLEGNESSCRDICTLWIELFDKYYDEFVANSEYPKLYADVINSWMLLIQQSEQLLTPWLITLNMPVREEIEGLNKKQADLLNKNQELEKELTALRNSG